MAGGGDPPPAVLCDEQHPTSADQDAQRAFDYLGNTFDFYWQAYQRNSIDDAGLPLTGSVYYGNKYDNAFWNGEQMVFGDGDGAIFNSFTIALDVVGHELTHRVTGSEANLRYTASPARSPSRSPTSSAP